MPADTPPWAAPLFQLLTQVLVENQRTREDLEALREAMGCHLVTRRQAAAMLGKSEKTIKRLEDRKELRRVNIEAPGIYYDLQQVANLKR